jgi:hypothetical protein
MFHVGQLVVCIRKIPVRSNRHLFRSGPRKGEIVTVRSAFSDPTDGKPVLYFDEHVNGIHPIWKLEIGFEPDYFRPIDKTSISIFTAMLSPTKADA